MTRLVAILLAGAACAIALAQMPPADEPAMRFAWVDLCVDSGATPLAAYQLELSAEPAQVKIVGIEGGEHAAFREAPYYDPAAMMGEKVILAAFSTGNDLPKGNTRVARVHVQVLGAVTRYTCKLTVAATTGGGRIPATLSLIEQGDTK